ncbi:MAG: hypothetical protein WCE64_05675 [Bacteroidales bacterium]
MTRAEKYDRLILGGITGVLLPLLAGIIFYLFSSGDQNLAGYTKKIVSSNILTHVISLCVFPNIFLFLVFNRFDMLRAARGVLGATIFWAILVFSVKFLV